MSYINFGADVKELAIYISKFNTLVGIREISHDTIKNIVSSDDIPKLIETYTNGIDIVKFYILKYIVMFTNKYDLFEALIPHTEPNIFFSEDNFLLKAAIKKNYTQVVKYLLEIGADITSEKYIAFRMITSFEILELFLKYDIDACMYNNFSIRFTTCYNYDNSKCIKLLIDHGADIDVHNGCILRKIIANCKTKIIIDLLLKSNNILKYGPDLINIAVDYGKTKIVKFLIDSGISLSCLQPKNICRILLSYSIENINFYRQQGLDFSSVNNYIDNYSIEGNNYIKHLIDNGVNIESFATYLLCKAVID
ncbi:putative ankyrin repeat protein [Powai lake megavirus]|uniref:Putative ankyrin repeat protein n=1 Tax=Powai lake megavirus TaxID=1842663 RepID=A0A167RL38_9VIRU|nr:putative ankyrin repeat protein [Powai lake megavirus]ANB50816.1 putative ankyrin repeat protein [Powai lake megavirus]